MKLKSTLVSSLNGPALDFAVAMCNEENQPHVTKDGRIFCQAVNNYGYYSPSTTWSQGGPIIEQEKFFLRYWTNSWRAETHFWIMYGPTPLIAAMRCYVASKLRDTIDIPEELIELHLSS